MPLNGESRELLSELDKKFAVLDVKLENHGTTAGNRHEENLDKFNSIFKKLNSLNCKAHTERMEGLKKDISWLWRVVYGVIIIGIGLGLWIKGAMG